MELVKIEVKDGKQLVSARELHEFLEVKSRFNDWIKNRIEKYDFVENTDFTTITNRLVTAQGNKSEYQDYIVSINAAKKLCIAEKSSEKAGALLNFLGQETIHIHTHTRFEVSFGNMLKEALDEMEIEVLEQFKVGKYKIDFYIPEIKMAIEYDEEQHFTETQTKKDEIRQKEITDELGCCFVRCDYRVSDIRHVTNIVRIITAKKIYNID